MASDTMTTWNEAFQVDYQPIFQDQIYGHSRTAQIIKSKGEMWTVGGQSLQTVFASRTVQGSGSSALSEAGDHATSRVNRAKNFTAGVAEYSFSQQWSGKLLSASRKAGPKFFKNLIDDRMEWLLDNIQFVIATRMFQNGAGAAVQIDTVSGTTNGILTLKTPGPIWFRPGQFCVVTDLTTAGTDQLTGTAATRGEIVDINRETLVVNLANVDGAAADDYLYLHGHYDNTEMNGLQNLINNSGTVQNVSRATVGNGYAKSFKIDRSASTLREIDFTNLNNRLSRFSNNKDSVGMFVTDYDSVTDLFVVVGDRHRYADNDTMNVGFKTMQIWTPDGAKPLIPEKMCNPGDVYALNPSTFAMIWPDGEEGGSWFDEDGQVIRPLTASSGQAYADGWVVHRTVRANMVCKDFPSNALLTNFSSP